MRIIVSSKYFANFLKNVINESHEFVIFSIDGKELRLRPIEHDEYNHLYNVEAVRDEISGDVTKKQLKKLRKYLKALPHQPVVIDFEQESIKVSQTTFEI
jgi:predicted Ser/Thr protein kinase